MQLMKSPGVDIDLTNDDDDDNIKVFKLWRFLFIRARRLVVHDRSRFTSVSYISGFGDVNGFEF